MLSFVTARNILANELQMPYSVFYLIIFVVKVAVIVVDILRYLSSLYGKATLVFVFDARLGLLRDGLRLVTEEAQGSGAPSFILDIKKITFQRIVQSMSPSKERAN